MNQDFSRIFTRLHALHLERIGHTARAAAEFDEKVSEETSSLRSECASMGHHFDAQWFSGRHCACCGVKKA